MTLNDLSTNCSSKVMLFHVECPKEIKLIGCKGCHTYHIVEQIIINYNKTE
jgi:hypothetical protein